MQALDGYVNSVNVFYESEARVKLWICEVLQTSLPTPFLPGLRNGCILCKLIQTISPSHLPTYHNNEETISVFHERENFIFFAEACSLVGLSSNYIFQYNDLVSDTMNEVKIVNCIERLATHLHFSGLSKIPIIKPNHLTPEQISEHVVIESARSAAIRKSMQMQRNYSFGSNRPSPRSTGVLRKGRTEMNFNSTNFNMVRPSASILALTSPRVTSMVPPSVKPYRAGSMPAFVDHSFYQEYIKQIVLMQSFWRASAARNKYKKDKQREKTRENIVAEIIATERTYIATLATLTEIFLKPLKEHQAAGFPAVTTLASEIEVISSYSRLLLTSLESRVANWQPSSKLGDIFLQITDFMKVYTQYVQDYDKFRDQLHQKKESTSFLQFLQKLERKVNNQPINGFIITPVQRLPRYQLLLQSLLKNTHVEHPDHSNLKKALDKMIDVTTYVDAKKIEYETINRVLTIQQKFSGKKLNSLALPHRRFVRDGQIKVANGSGSSDFSERLLFLFNDLLLVAKLRNAKRPFKLTNSIDLTHCSITECQELSLRTNCLDICKKDKVVCRIQFADAAEKLSWKTEIWQVQKDLVDRTNIFDSSDKNAKEIIDMLKSNRMISRNQINGSRTYINLSPGPSSPGSPSSPHPPNTPTSPRYMSQLGSSSSSVSTIVAADSPALARVSLSMGDLERCASLAPIPPPLCLSARSLHSASSASMFPAPKPRSPFRASRQL